MKIYTAGPMAGLSYDQIMERYQSQTKILRALGYHVICPMTGKSFLNNVEEFKGVGYNDHPLATDHAIKTRDRWMVGQVDIVLADFTLGKERVSIGTCMELAWADELHKHVVVVMEEDNIHQHCFITECASIVYPNIDDAYKYLETLINGI